jgi:hypothetical protein
MSDQFPVLIVEPCIETSEPKADRILGPPVGRDAVELSKCTMAVINFILLLCHFAPRLSPSETRPMATLGPGTSAWLLRDLDWTSV